MKSSVESFCSGDKVVGMSMISGNAFAEEIIVPKQVETYFVNIGSQSFSQCQYNEKNTMPLIVNNYLLFVKSNRVLQCYRSVPRPVDWIVPRHPHSDMLLENILENIARP